MCTRSCGWALILVLAFGAVAYAATDPADAMLGEWITAEGKGRVSIIKTVNDKKEARYHGKIVWLKEPKYPADDEEAGKTKHDRKNPDPAKRSKPILGLKVLEDFRYTGDKTWTYGTIYDPENGKTYKCTITMPDPTKLYVRGYIGFSLLGRTTTWTRYVKPEPDKPKAVKPQAAPARPAESPAEPSKTK